MPGSLPVFQVFSRVLIFPKPALYLLSWVALAPLIYAILKCREQDVTMALADRGLFLEPATAWPKGSYSAT